MKAPRSIDSISSSFHAPDASMRTLLFALFLPFQAHACLWVDGTTLDGGHRRVEGRHPAAELRYAMAKASDKKIEELVAMRRDEKASVFSSGKSKAFVTCSVAVTMRRSAFSLS